MLMHKARDDEKKTEERRHEGGRVVCIESKGPFQTGREAKDIRRNQLCLKALHLCRIPDGLTSRDFLV